MPDIRTVLNLLLFAMWILFLLFTLKRRWRLWVTVLIYAGMIGVFFILVALLPYELPELRQIISIAILFGCAMLSSSERLPKVLFVIGIMYACMLIGEVLSIAIYPELAQSADWSSVMTPAEQMRFALTYLLVQGLLLFFAAMLISRQIHRFSAKEWLLYAVFPISQIMLLNLSLPSEYKQNDQFMQAWLVVAALICVGVDVALFFSIRGMSQRMALKAQTAMLAQQIEAQKKHYAALTQQYEQMRRMRHDISNHVRTIQILLSKGDVPSAEAYASELLSEDQLAFRLGECENPIVDAFLYSRVESIRNNAMQIETDVRLPARLPVADTDLISIFGNLLDNAEEACMALPAEQRRIRLYAAVKDTLLAIRMENSMQPEIGRPSSLREAKPDRGLGFLILADVASRYNGNFQGKMEDGLYISMMTLRMEADA